MRSTTCPVTWSPPGFPGSAAGLARYDVTVLSDIGANSLLLSPDTFERSAIAPNRRPRFSTGPATLRYGPI